MGTHTGTTGFELGYRPALDGVRALAVLGVTVQHLRLGIGVEAGTVGVTVFFVLSGFLITALLVEEHERHGAVSLRHFWIRRAYRLAPALLVFVGLVAVFYIGAGQGLVDVGQMAFLNLTYTRNLMVLPTFYPEVTSHIWSLAVEEQFYLVWPLVMVAVLPRLAARRRTVMWAFVAAAGCSWLWRVVLWEVTTDRWRFYTGTDTRADALLVGGALALAMHGRHRWGRVRPGWWLAALAALSAVPFTSDQLAWWGITAIVLSAAGLVGSLMVHGGPGWLTGRPLVFVGRISYGMYLWHTVAVYVLVPTLGLEGVPALLFATATTVGVAAASWRWVERPVQERRSARPRPAVTRSGRAVVGLRPGQ